MTGLRRFCSGLYPGVRKRSINCYEAWVYLPAHYEFPRRQVVVDYFPTERQAGIAAQLARDKIRNGQPIAIRQTLRHKGKPTFRIIKPTCN